MRGCVSVEAKYLMFFIEKSARCEYVAISDGEQCILPLGHRGKHIAFSRDDVGTNLVIFCDTQIVCVLPPESLRTLLRHHF